MKSKNLVSAIAFASLALPSNVNAKSLIDYFQPTPTVCAVSTNTWGSNVPRDACNGLEDSKKPPQWIYWDGKIIQAADGKWHMLASRWAGSAGHGGWFGSQAVHAVSDSSPLGPFKDKGLAYTNGPDSGDRSKGHNVAAVTLPDGTYCLYVSETVPFTIFTSPSLDGPWTNKGHATIDNNGITVQLSGDTHIESNVSLVVRPDGNFEIVQRHGIIALSTTGIMGPYKVQKPTLKYSAAETPASSLPSIFPNRQKHTSADPQAPSSVENTAIWAEDPLIWYSGGLYHVVYDYPDDRVGYHLTSPDGIHNWEDRGLAYDPRLFKQLFSNTDGTAVSWYKMERPNVIMEDGHITHFTFAVTDVDKGQVTGGSNHGNKVIVLAFDGARFDAEMGVSVDGGVSDGTGGTGESGGGSATGGTTASSTIEGGHGGGGTPSTGGSAGASAGNSGTEPSSTGGLAVAGVSNSGGRGGSGGVASGGNPAGGSLAVSSATSQRNGGCSCHLGGGSGKGGTLPFVVLLGFLPLARRIKPYLRRRPLNPRPGQTPGVKVRMSSQLASSIEEQTDRQREVVQTVPIGRILSTRAAFLGLRVGFSGSVAVALNGDHVGVVDDAINERGGASRVGEDGGPVAECEIGGIRPGNHVLTSDVPTT